MSPLKFDQKNLIWRRSARSKSGRRRQRRRSRRHLAICHQVLSPKHLKLMTTNLDQTKSPATDLKNPFWVKNKEKKSSAKKVFDIFEWKKLTFVTLDFRKIDKEKKHLWKWEIFWTGEEKLGKFCWEILLWFGPSVRFPEKAPSAQDSFLSSFFLPLSL